MNNKTRQDAQQFITENRKARQRYTVEDHFEAGMVLTGSEVKSLRAGKVQLMDAYAYIKRGEVWLSKAHISAYSHGAAFNHEPERERKLLLKRSEIDKLKDKLDRRGYTLIPLSMYFSKGKAKVDLGLCVGKEAKDRRQEIKSRDIEREMRQAVKQKNR